MWYSTNFYSFPIELLLTSIRKPRIIIWLQAMFSPIILLDYKWQRKRIDSLYRIEHTFQVCYMRGALNDKFDPTERRIYIDGTGGEASRTYIATPPEQRPVYLGTVYIGTADESADSGVDFFVYVPREIMQEQSFEVRAEIDFYRLGGKRYLIIEI